MKENFRIDLEHLLNSYSIDNHCETPDFILADLVCEFLDSYATAVKKRDAWSDRDRTVISNDLTRIFDDLTKPTTDDAGDE